jgi:capsid protein
MGFFNKSNGRHFNRAGASLQGSLSNWVTNLIQSRVSEMEKRKVSNRAWDLYLNDAMAKGIIEGLVVEAINTGVTPQPHPMIDWLGKDSAWQKEYQKKAYDIFEIWGLDFRNFCDATGRSNIYMLQALAFFQWKLEGISVFQIVMQKDKNRPLGLSVLPIDPGRLITPTDADSKKNIYDGLELDKNGAIKKAWILKPDRPFASYSAKVDDCISINAVNKDTGFPNMLFTCDVRNVAEYRQDSIMSPMIKEIKDSNDFVDAALIKALIQNLWTAFVKSDSGAVAQNKPNDDYSDRIQEMEKGTMIFGREGEEASFLDSNTPGPSYEIMNRSIVSRLGMATGRGSENVSRSYTSSYSASRASIENATRFDDYDRMILNNRFNQPLFSLLQYEAALRGILPVTSIQHFKDNLYAYTRTDWMPPPNRPIDHGKEAKADSERLGNNTKTYSDIYGGQGADWRKKLKQAAIEKAYIKELEEEYDISMTAEIIAEETAETEGEDGNKTE